MKKKVTFVSLAAALALGSLAGAVGAATPQTPEEKFQALYEKGIFDGFPDGEAHLDSNMTRAQVSKIAVLILGLEEDASSASVYKDVKDSDWSAGFIGAATKAGIVEGYGNGVFDPNAPVTVEQLAKIMVKGLGINTGSGDAEVEGASDWAKRYVEAALKANLIPSSDDYTSNASRAKLVETTYEAYDLNTEFQAVREENKKSIGILLALDVMNAKDGKFNGTDNITSEDLTKIINVITNGKFDGSGITLPDNPTFSEILRLLLQSLGYPASALTDDSKLVEKAIEVGIIDADNVLLKTQLNDAPLKREWAALLTTGTVFKAGTVEVKEDGTVTINKDKHLSETIPVPEKPIQVDLTDVTNVPKFTDLKDIDPALVNRVTTPTPTTTPDPIPGPVGDVTAPRITAAKINGEAATVINGARGQITLGADVEYLTSGTITVNEAGTLTITAIENLDLTSEDFAEGFFTESLNAGENQFNLITKLGELDRQGNGVAVSYLELLDSNYNDDKVITITGTLRDRVGNPRTVTLEISLSH